MAASGGGGDDNDDEAPLLRVIDDAAKLTRHLNARDPTPDAKVVEIARAIVGDVRARGVEALVEHAVRLGDLATPQPPEKWVLGKEAMKAAFDSLDAEARGVLQRTAERIRAFAVTQVQFQ